MDSSGAVKSQLEMARNVHDMSSINTLRSAAKGNDPEALNEAAHQFEAIFVQMLLKSMRKAQDAIADKDSPFNSEQVKFYRDMHDQQLATDMSTNGSIGLADVIVQQMSLNAMDFDEAELIAQELVSGRAEIQKMLGCLNLVVRCKLWAWKSRILTKQIQNKMRED